MPKDGWDLGILIRLRAWGMLSFDRVMGELVSEVGWLKGNYKERDNELRERLNGLIEEGLIVKKDNPLYPDSSRQAYYEITQEGRDYVHG